MKYEKCEYGACKCAGKYETKTTLVATKEKRRFFLCKEHLFSLMQTSQSDGMIVNFNRVEEAQAV